MGHIHASTWKQFNMDPLDYENEMNSYKQLSQPDLLKIMSLQDAGSDDQIALYCMKGIRSDLMGNLLTEHGFTNVCHYSDGWWGYNSDWPMSKWEDWASQANFPLALFLKYYT